MGDRRRRFVHRDFNLAGNRDGPSDGIGNASGIQQIVGFAREGDDAHPGSGLAVVLSDRRAATKRLHVGARHAGEQWICVLGGHEPVTIGDDGNVELPVSDGGLSVYAPEAARPILDSAEQHLLRQR